MFKSAVVKTFLTVTILVAAFAAQAAFPWFSHGPKREVQTLIITGNYCSPRLMADLIQNESRQPYLLIPARDSGDTRIVFCQPKNNIQIREGKLNDFVQFLNPRRIVVLGSVAYVPQKYVDMLGKDIPVMRIECKNWQRCAVELNDMLNLSNLDKNFAKLRAEMEDARLQSRRAQAAQDAAEAVDTQKPAEAAADAESPANADEAAQPVDAQTVDEK
ncbi:MAG: hypothetical protein PHI35_02675 [Victivallaceae bacterium]|nr:hypothetical protein [Victivallaceae bacterium]